MVLTPLAVQPAASASALNPTTVQLGVDAGSTRPQDGLSQAAKEANGHSSRLSQPYLGQETDSGTDPLEIASSAEGDFSAAWISAVQTMKGQPRGMDAAGVSFLAAVGMPPADPATTDPSSRTAELAHGVGLRGEVAVPTLRLSADAVLMAKAPVGDSTPHPFTDAFGIAPRGSSPTDVDVARAAGPEAQVHSPILGSSKGIDGALGQIESAKAKALPAAVLVHNNVEGTDAPHQVGIEAVLQPTFAGTRGLYSQELATSERRTSSDLAGNFSRPARIAEAEEIGDAEAALHRFTETGRTPTDGSLYPPAFKHLAETLGLADAPEPTSAPHDTTPRAPSSRGTAGLEQGAAFADLASRRTLLPESAPQERSLSTETAFQAEIRPKTADVAGKSPALGVETVKPQRPASQSNSLAGTLRNPKAAASASLGAQPASEPAPARAEWVELHRGTPFAADVPGSSSAPAPGATPRPSAQAATPPAAQVDTAEFDTTRVNGRPAGEVTVQLRSEGHGTANIRFSERAGEVQVTVRAADPQLVHSLRAGLDHLKNGLDMQGFQTSVWTAGSAAQSQSLKASPGSSPDTYHPADEDHTAQDAPAHEHSRQRNQDAEEWMDEID